MLLNLAKGARNSMVVGHRRGHVRAPRRRHARVDRRLLQAGRRRRAHHALQHAARDPAVRARAVARHGVRHRRRSTRTGNQHPPSSIHRLFVLIFALGYRVDPDPRRASRARTRCSGRSASSCSPPARRARPTSGSWCARCSPTCCPAMFSIALLGDRGRDRRRGRPVDPRRRRPAARGVVGQHDRQHPLRPADAAVRAVRADRLHLPHGAVAQLPR